MPLHIFKLVDLFLQVLEKKKWQLLYGWLVIKILLSYNSFLFSMYCSIKNILLIFLSSIIGRKSFRTSITSLMLYLIITFLPHY